MLDTLITVSALFLIAVVTLTVSGGAVMTVLTESMEPNINPGDVIVNVHAEANDIKRGDVITFQPVTPLPGNLPNTHRVQDVIVTNGEVTSIVTRGDNNAFADQPITPDRVLSKNVFVIPKLGLVNVMLFKNDLPNLQQIGIVVVALCGMYALVAKLAKMIRRK